MAAPSGDGGHYRLVSLGASRGNGVSLCSVPQKNGFLGILSGPDSRTS